MSEIKIVQLTKSLLEFNRSFHEYYQGAREKEITYDFDGEIKPFVNEVKTALDNWNMEVRQWLKVNPQKHLHLKQVETTADHIEQMSIQAFFSKTSKSRFLNANRTVDFFLTELLKELEKIERDA
jgi:Bacterial domain of unknown function (DUF1798)